MTSATLLLQGSLPGKGLGIPVGRTYPRGFFRRILDAIADANRRKAEREIGRFIQRNGGKFTDSMERSIERAFL
jgi:hypothetical protein